MKTKATRSRRLRSIPNNKKLRQAQLYHKYSTKPKKVKKPLSFNDKLRKLSQKRLGL